MGFALGAAKVITKASAERSVLSATNLPRHQEPVGLHQSRNGRVASLTHQCAQAMRLHPGTLSSLLLEAGRKSCGAAGRIVGQDHRQSAKVLLGIGRSEILSQASADSAGRRRQPLRQSELGHGIGQFHHGGSFSPDKNPVNSLAVFWPRSRTRNLRREWDNHRKTSSRTKDRQREQSYPHGVAGQ
ncbi:hypothetical protein CMI47_17900 [Candidatus Pacearchaeota archaeon]|nr:hypothetical protein [Candidatus Pacearchaeota archaeon]